jgi:hypothetical protein
MTVCVIPFVILERIGFLLFLLAGSIKRTGNPEINEMSHSWCALCTKNVWLPSVW